MPVYCRPQICPPPRVRQRLLTLSHGGASFCQVRTAIAASRQRGLPIAMVGGGQAATMRTGELSDQETSQVMQVERMQVCARRRAAVLVSRAPARTLPPSLPPAPEVARQRWGQPNRQQLFVIVLQATVHYPRVKGAGLLVLDGASDY